MSGSDAKLHITRRHLPHWTQEGSTYFVTFRLASGTLSEEEVKLVKEQIVEGDSKHYELFAAVVLPDHAHLLLQPNAAIPLRRIVKGIKGVSARRLNRLRGTRGRV